MLRAEVDEHSSTWRALTSHATRKIEESRVRIETIGLSEREADVERGKIAALREVMELTQRVEKVAVAADETGYRLQSS